MSERLYLSTSDILALHLVLIRRYGGAEGIRDVGALESAVFRAQSGYYDDAIAEAAALFESLVINHPFLDGNKRVAFASMDVFLRLNGYRIARSSVQVHQQIMLWFDDRSLSARTVEAWLRDNVQTED